MFSAGGVVLLESIREGKEKREKVQRGVENGVAQDAPVAGWWFCGDQDIEFEESVEDFPCGFEEEVRKLVWS